MRRAAAGLLLAVCVLGRPTSAGAQTPPPPGFDPRLFVVGDSVMLGARDAIVQRFPGWQVNVYAQEGLSTLAAPSVINASRASSGDVVVAALGNNDAGDPVTFGQRIDGVMRSLATVPRVIWVNLHRFASWVPAMDAQLSQATARWPNLEIADWDARATPNPSLVYGDGLHLTPAGQAAMAELVAEHVDAYARQHSTPSTTIATPPSSSPPRVRTKPHRAPSPTQNHGNDDALIVGAAGVGLVLALAAIIVALRSRTTRRRARSPEA